MTRQRAQARRRWREPIAERCLSKLIDTDHTCSTSTSNESWVTLLTRATWLTRRGALMELLKGLLLRGCVVLAQLVRELVMDAMSTAGGA